MIERCWLYPRDLGCSCYEGPLLRLRPNGEAWQSLLEAGTCWTWRFEAPDRPAHGDRIAELADSLRPLGPEARAEFENVISRWDTQAFSGPEIELILFDKLERPITPQRLRKDLQALDAGAETNIKAYVFTLQDQVSSFVYYPANMQLWIDGLMKRTSCSSRVRPYKSFRFKLSEALNETT